MLHSCIIVWDAGKTMCLKSVIKMLMWNVYKLFNFHVEYSMVLGNCILVRIGSK